MESIKIIKLVNGDDIVCTIPQELLDEKSPLVKIDKPLQIKYIPAMEEMGLKDYVALIKWTSYSDDSIISIPKDKIMTITSAGKAMTNSYKNVSNGYDKATMTEHKQDRYDREQLDDSISEKLNEIFEDLDGTTKH
jgi:hypothetical protein|tara:strand:- start:321 stop:728 length:408 start_codon:yes stop_codon:yes gene_type:complete